MTTRAGRKAYPRLRFGLVGALLALCGIYDLIYILTWLGRGVIPRYGDFFALWSFGRFAAVLPPETIYDTASLQRFQESLVPAFSAAYPFLYPPSFLLVAVPLAVLPLGAAWCAWSAGTAALHVAAVLGRDWPTRAGAALVVAPTTLLCIVAGQTGLLVSSVMIGGLRAVEARPWLGGALLGMLTIKPQLGVLLPVALVAAGQWRAMAAAAGAAAAVVAASGLGFGWHIWLTWLLGFPAEMAMILQNRVRLAQIAPTVSAGLFQLGIPDAVARPLALLTLIAAGMATFRAFRRGMTADAIAVLAMATVLATPYAYVYDMPMVTGALVLSARARTPSRAEAVLFCLITVVPLAMLATPLPLVEPGLLAAGVLTLLIRQATALPARG